jgi:hypothetical protein
LIQKQDFKAVAKLTIIVHMQQYLSVCKLLEIDLCIVVSSSLSTESLSMQMKLGLGPDVDSFDYAVVVSPWKKEKRRCLARLYFQNANIGCPGCPFLKIYL